VELAAHLMPPNGPYTKSQIARALGDFLRAAEAWINFYNRERSHESLNYRSPNQFAEVNQLQTLPYLTVF
jgi:transposase InsO family protein